MDEIEEADGGDLAKEFMNELSADEKATVTQWDQLLQSTGPRKSALRKFKALGDVEGTMPETFSFPMIDNQPSDSWPSDSSAKPEPRASDPFQFSQISDENLREVFEQENMPGAFEDSQMLF